MNVEHSLDRHFEEARPQGARDLRPGAARRPEARPDRGGSEDFDPSAQAALAGVATRKDGLVPSHNPSNTSLSRRRPPFTVLNAR